MELAAHVCLDFESCSCVLHVLALHGLSVKSGKLLLGPGEAALVLISLGNKAGSCFCAVMSIFETPFKLSESNNLVS